MVFHPQFRSRRKLPTCLAHSGQQPHPLATSSNTHHISSSCIQNVTTDDWTAPFCGLPVGDALRHRWRHSRSFANINRIVTVFDSIRRPFDWRSPMPFAFHAALHPSTHAFYAQPHSRTAPSRDQRRNHGCRRHPPRGAVRGRRDGSEVLAGPRARERCLTARPVHLLRGRLLPGLKLVGKQAGWVLCALGYRTRRKWRTGRGCTSKYPSTAH